MFHKIFKPCTYFILSSISLTCFAEGAVHLTPKNCTHGLIAQPNGPFSLFTFCDDALGINVGVINTEPAAGPGEIKLIGTKPWLNWSVDDRFWQSKEWSVDVNSYYWSKDLKSLWIGTSSIYGTGDIYWLDLVGRRAINLTENINKKGMEFSIASIDESKNKLEIKVSAWDEDTGKEQLSTRIIDSK